MTQLVSTIVLFWVCIVQNFGTSSCYRDKLCGNKLNVYYLTIRFLMEIIFLMSLCCS